MNHSFLVGNSESHGHRAWSFTQNGYRVRVSADEAERFLIEQVIVGHAELAAIAGLLEMYMRSV